MRKMLLALSMLAISASQLEAQPFVWSRDFDSWSLQGYHEPAGTTWITSNEVSLRAANVPTANQVAGYNSTYALRLDVAATATDTFPAFATNSPGILDDEGGQPYTGALPTSVTGFMRYKLFNTDTVFIICTFKKNGAIVGSDIFPVRGTGVQNSFTQFNFPITCSSIPDTVLFAASIGNPVSEKRATPGSWLELDSLATGTASGSVMLANGNFEAWQDYNIEIPIEWEHGYRDITYFPGTVSSTTSKYSGTFAARLTTYYNRLTQEVEPSAIRTYAPILSSGASSGTDSLIFYYKYITSGILMDMAGVSLQYLDAQDNPLGLQIIHTLNDIGSYVRYAVPLENKPANTSRVLISFLSSLPIPTANVGSQLYVDAASIKYYGVGINDIPKQQGISFYPNPAHDVLHLAGIINMPYSITDMSGRTIANGTMQQDAINIGHLPAGCYILMLQSADGSSMATRFDKQ